MIIEVRRSKIQVLRVVDKHIGDRLEIMFDSSSYDNPTPLAHADTLRDVLPRGGTSQLLEALSPENFKFFEALGPNANVRPT
ncbi:hypothetical protein TNCV_4880751 [Trichonephila clavipes]|nr:hypothetical protein TNCV_4880751 [Trichonephila clavipes]